jgi:hypothetical protein
MIRRIRSGGAFCLYGRGSDNPSRSPPAFIPAKLHPGAKLA